MVRYNKLLITVWMDVLQGTACRIQVMVTCESTLKSSSLPRTYAASVQKTTNYFFTPAHFLPIGSRFRFKEMRLRFSYFVEMRSFTYLRKCQNMQARLTG